MRSSLPLASRNIGPCRHRTSLVAGISARRHRQGSRRRHPATPSVIDLGIRELSGGLVSPRLVREVRPGEHLEVRGPYGRLPSTVVVCDAAHQPFATEALCARANGLFERVSRRSCLPRLKTRRSLGASPPQTPSSWLVATANVRQWRRTSHAAHTALARPSCNDAPSSRSPSGKKRSGAFPRHAARLRQRPASHSSRCHSRSTRRGCGALRPALTAAARSAAPSVVRARPDRSSAVVS